MRYPARIATLPGHSRRFRFPVRRYEIAWDSCRFPALKAPVGRFPFAFQPFCEMWGRYFAAGVAIVGSGPIQVESMTQRNLALAGCRSGGPETAFLPRRARRNESGREHLFDNRDRFNIFCFRRNGKNGLHGAPAWRDRLNHAGRQVGRPRRGDPGRAEGETGAGRRPAASQVQGEGVCSVTVS
jgi:hypothetical protein